MMVERQAMVDMHRDMRDAMADMQVGEVFPDSVMPWMREAMMAMERVVAVMDGEPGVIPVDMRD